MKIAPVLLSSVFFVNLGIIYNKLVMNSKKKRCGIFDKEINIGEITAEDERINNIF